MLKQTRSEKPLCAGSTLGGGAKELVDLFHSLLEGGELVGGK
jgi:hypothetical protein